MQRFFDIIFSGIALLTLSPLLIPVIIFLKMTGEGEVFYFQERVGKGGAPFSLVKFATMLKNSLNMNNGSITVKNDPRVLPLGKFLRKSKINELPQLLNIFLGNMSIIGPRPLTIKNFNAYSKSIQNCIVKVQPGLSGIGSIIFRGEEDILADEKDPIHIYNSVIAPYKGRLEEWYVNNRSIKIYFICIFITIWVVIYPKSGLVWSIFPSLPSPPENLRVFLNYYE
ncbi:sugar transferase [Polynucleobacter nymphae]|uniref:sugar transferase n=1 Tax=Polynucleobacter nymphae TaxID=2081043 RepID=UPI001C0E59EA|nr:sugar transferase [Polynucleobacter nymphae]MBU3607768.1 sugar transferase [Polynucleobacter nymphae]